MRATRESIEGDAISYAIILVSFPSLARLRKIFERIKLAHGRDLERGSRLTEYLIIADALPHQVATRIDVPENTFLLNIDEFERQISSRKRRPERSPNTRPLLGARTRVGRAIAANNTTIILLSESMLLLIEEKLSELNERHGLNDPDSILERNASLAVYTKLKKSLEELRDKARQFGGDKGDSEKEKKAVEASTTFVHVLRDWWTKHGDAASQMGLLSVGMTIAYLTGHAGTISATVIGVIAAGKPMIDVIKSMKKAIWN
jgi:hypothetical protein